jgi:hypothetical protein
MRFAPLQRFPARSSSIVAGFTSPNRLRPQVFTTSRRVSIHREPAGLVSCRIRSWGCTLQSFAPTTWPYAVSGADPLLALVPTRHHLYVSKLSETEVPSSRTTIQPPVPKHQSRTPARSAGAEAPLDETHCPHRASPKSRVDRTSIRSFWHPEAPASTQRHPRPPEGVHEDRRHPRAPEGIREDQRMSAERTVRSPVCDPRAAGGSSDSARSPSRPRSRRKSGGRSPALPEPKPCAHRTSVPRR